MKNTGIFLIGISDCFSLSFPRPARASPFSCRAASFRRVENIQALQEGRLSFSFFFESESLAERDSVSRFAFDAA